MAAEIWPSLGVSYARNGGTPLLIASVISGLGVAAATKLAWQYFIQPMHWTATRLPEEEGLSAAFGPAQQPRSLCLCRIASSRLHAGGLSALNAPTSQYQLAPQPFRTR
jgi:hypothetical protein